MSDVDFLNDEGVKTLIISAIVSAIAGLFAWLKSRRRSSIDTNKASDERILGSTEQLVNMANKQRDDAIKREAEARKEADEWREKYRLKDRDFELLQDSFAETNRLFRAAQQKIEELTQAVEAFRHQYEQPTS